MQKYLNIQTFTLVELVKKQEFQNLEEWKENWKCRSGQQNTLGS